MTLEYLRHRACDAFVKMITDERAKWLADHVLPREPQLRGWLLGRRIKGVDVDDVIQETYAVLAALPSVEGIRNPRDYTFKVAHSIVLQQLRRTRIVSIEAVADWDRLGHSDEQPSPERAIVARDELRRIYSEIEALPPRCREVFRLRRLEGLSQREIASRLGIAEGTVEKQMQKGIALLMRRIGRTGKAGSEASTGVSSEGMWSDAHEQTRVERRN
jgi:RNA polymerase sigma factor (sigma-70 family)